MPTIRNTSLVQNILAIAPKRDKRRKQSRILDHPAMVRKEMGLNQTTFWRRVGVAQSCGSRFESNRAVPMSVAMLLLAMDHGLLSPEQLDALALEAAHLTHDE